MHQRRQSLLFVLATTCLLRASCYRSSKRKYAIQESVAADPSVNYSQSPVDDSVNDLLPMRNTLTNSSKHASTPEKAITNPVENPVTVANTPGSAAGPPKDCWVHALYMIADEEEEIADQILLDFKENTGLADLIKKRLYSLKVLVLRKPLKAGSAPRKPWKSVQDMPVPDSSTMKTVYLNLESSANFKLETKSDVGKDTGDFLTDFVKSAFPPELECRQYLELSFSGMGPFSLGRSIWGSRPLQEVLAKALESSSRGRVDLLAFNANYMANFEVLEAISPFADIILASEEVFPHSAGLNHTLLKPFAPGDKFQDAQALAKSMLVDFNKPSKSTPRTLSLVDASKFQVVAKQFNEFCSLLTQLIQGRDSAAKSAVQTLLKARQNALTFQSPLDDNADFGSFVDIRSFGRAFYAVVQGDNLSVTDPMLTVASKLSFALHQFGGDVLDVVAQTPMVRMGYRGISILFSVSGEHGSKQMPAHEFILKDAFDDNCTCEWLRLLGALHDFQKSTEAKQDRQRSHELSIFSMMGSKDRNDNLFINGTIGDHVVEVSLAYGWMMSKDSTDETEGVVVYGFVRPRIIRQSTSEDRVWAANLERLGYGEFEAGAKDDIEVALVLQDPSYEYSISGTDINYDYAATGIHPLFRHKRQRFVTIPVRYFPGSCNGTFIDGFLRKKAEMEINQAEMEIKQRQFYLYSLYLHSPVMSTPAGSLHALRPAGRDAKGFVSFRKIIKHAARSPTCSARASDEYILGSCYPLEKIHQMRMQFYEVGAEFDQLSQSDESTDFNSLGLVFTVKTFDDQVYKYSASCGRFKDQWLCPRSNLMNFKNEDMCRRLDSGTIKLGPTGMGILLAMFAILHTQTKIYDRSVSSHVFRLRRYQIYW